MPDTNKQVDALIVGAGFTGLAAARKLSALGVDDVLVVDAFEGHLGGRAFSYDAPVPAGTKLRYDHGAQYVGDLQNEIMKQILDLCGPDELVNGAELRQPYPYQIMYLNQERMAFRFDKSLFGITGVPPQIGFWGGLQMLALLGEMTIIERFIDVVEPWNGHASLLALDETDIWSWLKKKWWVNDQVRDLVRISVEALLSVEPSEISPYYFLWYCACNEGFINEINDDIGGPQQYWLKGGTAALAKRYAEPVADKIRGGSKVTAIDTSGDDVVATLADGSRVTAKRVIIATSPHSAGRSITFTPPLSQERKTMLAQPMGRTLKCQIYYKSSWWHQAADGKAYNGYVGGANYPVLWVMDNSPLDADETGGPHVLMTFTVGGQLDKLGSAPSHEQIVEWVTGTLARQFEDERALSTSPEFIELRSYLWNPEQPEVGGGPNSIFKPGQLTGAVGKLLNEPWEDKIYFASAETSMNAEPQSSHTSWSLFAKENLPAYDDDRRRKAEPAPPYFSKYSDRRKSLGYMDGAMHAGDYAARQVAAALGHDVALPKPPTRAKHLDEAPPLAAPHAPADVVTIVKALRSALDAVEHAELEAHAADHFRRGRLSQASWLRDTVAAVLHDLGLAQPDDPIGTLAAIRDFVIGASSLLKPAKALDKAVDGAVGEVEDAIAEHRDTLRAEIEAAEERIAALF